MATRVNPFHELYLGDSIGPDKFVLLFSDIIVDHALPMFQPGHVILRGLPGTGKSMLLNLLKPAIRIAYANSDSRAFPVPSEFRKFIGAGINLKRSGISDFGQRPINNDNPLDTSAIYFGDFLNYWVVSDVLENIRKLATQDPSNTIAKEIGINYSDQSLNRFAQKFSISDCWQGYFGEVKTYNDFRSKINKRITDYRAFLNYNSSELSIEIQQTKTIIGNPITRCVELLRDFKIIEKEVEVFIRIDQYEELAWLDKKDTKIGNSFQSIIHKLLGMRDSNVSYRIGTRHFAWAKDKKMFGSDARLEKKRNFTEISIDSVLKRKENARTWVFPRFAEDIFQRRINLSPYKSPLDHSDHLLSYVFGKGYTPHQRAMLYVPNEKFKAIRFEKKWNAKWKDFLQNLAIENPLSARLGEAWSRQKGKEGIMNNIPSKQPYPWDSKTWWKKERIEQALMQIASRNQQQLIWYGKDDILGLSGGNILIFLSLCQHIWDVWIRDKRNENSGGELILPQIDSEIQSAGIRETSYDWLEDISDEKGGKERKLFISYLGRLFYKSLVEDKAMSYPGNNGFSLTIEDLEKNEIVYQFLKDASDYGDLYDAPHTTKLSDKKARHKWYMNPILSPYFKIPYSHTKEPIYCKIDLLIKWLLDSEAIDENEIMQKKSTESKEKKSYRNNNMQGKLNLL